MTPLNDAGPSSVWTQAIRGHRSTLLAQVTRLACKAISVVTLARLLTPAEHGLYAMAASVFLFLFLFRDLGLGTVTVQAAALDETQLSSLFWMHALLGALLMMATLAVAPLAAAFYATPRVGPLLAGMCVAFLAIGFGGFPRALLARELRFPELNCVETAGAVLGTLAMLAAAVAGAGAWTFVIYLLVSETAIAALAWRASRWRPRARLDWASARKLTGRGMHLTGYHAVNYWLQQLDTFAIGRMLGAGTLGLYSRTGQLLGLANLHVAGPLTQVALAALSRVGHDAAEFRSQARTTATMITHLTLPLAAVCVAIPGEVVRVVLGPQWSDAAMMLRWLAVSTGLFTATSLVYGVNVAAGQAHRLQASALASLPFIALAVWLGIGHGAAGVAAALAGMNLLLTVPRLAWMLHGSPLRVRDFIDALAGPFALAAALGAGMAAGRALALHESFVMRLAAEIAGGGIAVALLVALQPRIRGELNYLRTHLLDRPFTTPPSSLKAPCGGRLR